MAPCQTAKRRAVPAVPASHSVAPSPPRAILLTYQPGHCAGFFLWCWCWQAQAMRRAVSAICILILLRYAKPRPLWFSVTRYDNWRRPCYRPWRVGLHLALGPALHAPHAVAPRPIEPPILAIGVATLGPPPTRLAPMPSNGLLLVYRDTYLICSVIHNAPILAIGRCAGAGPP